LTTNVVTKSGISGAAGGLYRISELGDGWARLSCEDGRTFVALSGWYEVPSEEL